MDVEVDRVKLWGIRKDTAGGIPRGDWNTGRRIESIRVRKGKATKLEIYLIDLWDTLHRVQAVSWWEWEDGLDHFFWRWNFGYLDQSQYGVGPWIK